MKLVWSSQFIRAFKRLSRTQPDLLDELERVLHVLEEEPFHPSLRTHKLKGVLKNCWASSGGYDFRVVFEFQKNPKTKEQEILLLSAGTHDQVY